MSKRSNRARRQDKKKDQNPHAAVAADAQDIEQALSASFEKLQRGQAEKAEQIARKAIARHPGDPRLMSNLVAALENQGRGEDALRAASAAAEANPDDPQCRNNLGALLKFQGHLDEASKEFRRAVELAPQYAPAWRNLAGLKTFEDPDDPDLAAMVELLPRVPREKEARTSLYFAIARAYDQLGNVDEAFTHFERGNRLKRSNTPMRMREVTQLIDDTIEHQTIELIQKGPAEGASDAAPILIVGMPRSGSTLVEQILASHPAVEGVGEVPDLGLAIEPHVGNPVHRVRTVAGLDDASVAAIGKAYAASLSRRVPEAERVVDKYLTNFVHLGTLRRALPNARFVHVRRGPMDNGFGCYRTLFTSNIPYAYEFGEIAGTYAETHRLMDHWRAALPEALYELDYEALVADLEGESRRLLEFLGLPWSDACLRFHETDRRVNSASATQVRKPLFTSSVGRWRRYEKQLKPLAAAFRSCGVEIPD